ncbi:uncharacterized protein [Henckelia pumila]|uniref:uncharacterized protein n=1 Tax=Henckelia pumila TaxID=405737 RepID=UPI003C6E2B6E
MKQNNYEEDEYLSPSFNCYSTEKLAEIAVKVAVEDEEDGAFEFTLIREDDEVLAYDGQISSIFPVFDLDLVVSSDSAEAESLGIPVSSLFIGDREPSDRNRLSSELGDERETVPPGTYCIWRPKPAASPVLCKKSKSTGSTPRSWKFSDLLRRSNSDGKDNYVFLTPKINQKADQKYLMEASKIGRKVMTGKAKPISGGGPGSPSPHEVLYTWNRAVNAEKRKKSYLPYRQELVGFFANVNGFSRSFPHF